MLFRLVQVFGLFIAFIVVAKAQDKVVDFRNYKPEVQIVRIETDQAPIIDGDLSDPAWSMAAKVDEFYQVDPVEGGTPSERTVAYMAYDENNLYFAFYSYSEFPNEILATVMQRDHDVWKDNVVRVYLDPYNTSRDAISFMVNALGTQQDRLIENNTTIVDEWDTIWDVEAKIVDDGWIAEMAIPFRSISFDPNIETWGLDLTRDIRHKNERLRWSQINQSLSMRNVSQIGQMTGIHDTRRGLGLDVQAFAKAGFKRERNPRDDDLSIEPSGNIFYKITPALTGTFTFNTDFSDSPQDERQVNTGRFGLFFPETRDFMLQDKAIFEFGGNALMPEGSENPNGIPFFSRRIGIVQDQVVDIVAGGKLSGRLGPVNVGALTVRTSNEANINAQTLSVARVSTEVLEESRIGAILTHGDPSGLDTNTVFGFDFQYLDSNFLNYDGRFIADFFYQRSMSEEVTAAGSGKDDDSYGFYIAYPNDLLHWSISGKEFGEHFAPAMGFVNRRNIRDYKGDYIVRKRPADSWLRWWEVGASFQIVTDLNNNIETHWAGLTANMENQIGDKAGLTISNVRENITQAFSIAGQLPVRVDDYHFNQFKAYLESSNSRRGIGVLAITCCEFYDGDYLAISTSLELRASKHFRVTVAYDMENFNLPNGDVTVHIGSLDTSINFTPDMQIDTQVQYDNISERLSFFSRFRWFPRPETEFFISLGHTANIESKGFPGGIISDQTQAIIRLGHTFRF